MRILFVVRFSGMYLNIIVFLSSFSRLRADVVLSKLSTLITTTIVASSLSYLDIDTISVKHRRSSPKVCRWWSLLE